jgi:enoyl-CoA hydratase/carnithine racemase
MSPRIVRADTGALCTLTLNRPEKLNALDTRAFEELDAQLAALENETDKIGCVVLRGAGRGFCAGADLQAMGKVPVPPEYKPGVVARLGRLTQPVIAAVHGVCLTGGLELALACDFILADESASFADTHGRFGLVGAWGMGQRLRRRIGEPAAKRLMMTGARIGAVEAKALGLADLIVPVGELDGLVYRFCNEILLNSWHTNFAAKQMMRETDGMTLQAGLEHEQRHYPGNAPDHAERVARFTKR